MSNIVVCSTGPDTGKTVVSAVLATLLKADYWKPIQCASEQDSDTYTMHRLLNPNRHRIHPPAYAFKTPVSPHHAARLENLHIQPEKLVIPTTQKPLIVELAGGVLVPIAISKLGIDHYVSWPARWVLVSRHYIGSINHTLLTIEALRRRNITLLGLIFNGTNPDSEAAILSISKLPMLARLTLKPRVDKKIIKSWANEWYSLIPLLR